MNTKKVMIDYGDKRLEIDVPNHATVLEFEDPPFLSDPSEAVRHALASPQVSEIYPRFGALLRKEAKEYGARLRQ